MFIIHVFQVVCKFFFWYTDKLLLLIPFTFRNGPLPGWSTRATATMEHSGLPVLRAVLEKNPTGQEVRKAHF